jgi:AcrR family transcriptional regulator
MTSSKPSSHTSHTTRPGRPRGPRRDRDERRAELLDAAERAIRRVGPKASMDEIAAEAGITKPILYAHFGDKAGLVQALAGRVARRLNRTVTDALTRSGEPRDVVASTIEAFCTFIEDETELYRFLVQSAGTTWTPRARACSPTSAARSRCRSAARCGGQEPIRALPSRGRSPSWA